MNCVEEENFFLFANVLSQFHFTPHFPHFPHFHKNKKTLFSFRTQFCKLAIIIMVSFKRMKKRNEGKIKSKMIKKIICENGKNIKAINYFYF